MKWNLARCVVIDSTDVRVSKYNIELHTNQAIPFIEFQFRRRDTANPLMHIDRSSLNLSWKFLRVVRISISVASIHHTNTSTFTNCVSDGE